MARFNNLSCLRVLNSDEALPQPNAMYTRVLTLTRDKFPPLFVSWIFLFLQLDVSIPFYRYRFDLELILMSLCYDR